MGATVKSDVPGYSWYMRSSAWERKKQAYRDSGRACECRVCGSARIHFHHRTYVRFMEEDLDDLIPLCEDHHADLHLLQREEGLTVEVATHRFLRSRGRRSPVSLSPEERAWLAQRRSSSKARLQEFGKQAELRKKDRVDAIARQLELGVPPAVPIHVGRVDLTEDGLIRSSGSARVRSGTRNKRRKRR